MQTQLDEQLLLVESTAVKLLNQKSPASITKLEQELPQVMEAATLL